MTVSNNIFGVTGLDPVQLKLVTGTSVEIDPGSRKVRALAPIPVQITGLAAALPAATTTVAGVVKKAATVANATDAASVITQLNLLITNMRAAGQIV